MEAINQYLVLILSGIIIGGVITLNLIRHRESRTVEFAHQQYPNNTSNSGIWIVGVFVFFFTFLFFQKLELENTAAKTILPKNQKAEGTLNTQSQREEVIPSKSYAIKTANSIAINKKPKKYFLQVAAFDNHHNAIIYKNELSEKTDLNIHILHKKNAPIPYKILIGGFTSKAESAQFIRQTGITGFTTEWKKNN